MAIYRCNKCGRLEELAATEVGAARACPACGHTNTVYDTVFFTRKLLERYFVLQTAMKRLQAETEEREAEPGSDVAAVDLQRIDLHNTDQIATDLQHGPIHDWFRAKQIQVRADLKAVDTTGFFDEVAVEIGQNYELHKSLIDQIRYAQTRNHTGLNVALAKRSQREQQQITAFCRMLYDYSFVSKYFYQKNEKVIRMGLQASARVRDFFAGEWLEWFALMQVLQTAQKSGGRSSCARSLKVVFQNEDVHELDVFALLGGTVSLCIECKTGEFRPFIDKYDSLRRRLGLNRKQFVVCVAGLADEQASGLGAMYDLTFVNEAGLARHIETLLA
ncbi:MAG: hypothetical protein ACK4KV_04455 [Rhodocyclaceae bacterium]